MSKSRNATLLDIDSSIIENNLLLDSNRNQDDDLSKLFPNLPTTEFPSKLVRPLPGFCIKIRKSDATKVFINVCQTDAIPPPEDITELRLAEILQSDEASNYRVPMSIGNPRQEPDKSGTPSDVYDVAINNGFLKKIDESLLFRNFLLQVVFEGVQQKYEIELKTDEFVVLKNRKAMGNLQQHRIQQRDVKAALPPRLLIEEVGSTASDGAPALETVKSGSAGTRQPVSAAPLNRTVPTSRQPPYRLFREPNGGHLVGEFDLTGVRAAKELTLDVGEDRLILEARRQGYLIDVFVPCALDQEDAIARFDRDTGMLTVRMGVLASG